ncbi:Gfo/Idh/MocA family protein [Pelagibacterium montanilacus]|uniref:Gfo/Idh/MocA family protein n=1 Tax=Pelagibacterium montanilacus TaxID=2185280 RepID=UPI0013E0868C|nr:Gfo/Idh/MocA family oxidoreductase [Pelagibacterium montanilacus]
MPDTNSRPRVALIGCGAFANAALVPAMRMAPLDVVAVCDLDEARAVSTQHATGAPHRFSTAEELVKFEDIDAAVVAIGPTVYPRLVPGLLEAGLDVFVEKPPALAAADARAMQQAAKAAGKQLAVGFMKRFATGYRMAREITERPEFGRVAHVSARISTGVWKPVWAKELDAFSFVMDHSVHFLDLIAFFGGPVRSVTALPLVRDGGRMGFAVLLGFDNGATGVLEISNLESRGVPNERVQIMGDRGQSVTVENVTRVTYSREAAPMAEGRPFDPDTERQVWEPNMTNISQENASVVHMGYAGEMRNFARALSSGEPISPDIADGVAALDLAHAVLTSDGASVTLQNGTR